MKHAGLTAFVVDMHGAGVEVRPLRQMTGEAEFNEVYFTDTRIPELGDARQAGRRLARLVDHADERASVDRWHHSAEGFGHHPGADIDMGERCRMTARTRRRSTRS